MSHRRQHLFSLAMAIVMTAGAGSSALADDTELLVLYPDATEQQRPNILFIIDSSGSMETNELVAEDYDPDQSYAGACDTSSLYWTTQLDADPECSTSIALIEKTSFFCDRGLQELRAAGAYIDKLTQYRNHPAGETTEQWARLSTNDSTGAVECARDSGVHGETATSPAVFPQRGVDVARWTSESSAALVWGAGLADTTYKIVDGNYLNWAANPPLVEKRRIDIIEDVSRTVLGTLDGVNLGLMRFNTFAGGRVIKAIDGIESTRSELIATIDSIEPSGDTPLSETLYEAARYFMGLSVDFGDEEEGQDLAAVNTASEPDTYVAPRLSSCARNFVVLLTDGLPNSDTQTESRLDQLPDFATVTGRTACTDAGTEGACLDDMAEYLARVDINGVEAGNPHVTTYTIGFRTDFPLLQQTANAGEGQYFTADDTQELTAALTEIFSTINEREVSFTAPAVPVNTFNRAQNRNEIYVTVFRADRNLRWPGNLKKYRLVDGVIVDANGIEAVDPATGFFKEADPETGQTQTARSFWSDVDDGRNVELGGAANELPDSSARDLYTNLTGDENVDLTTMANSVSLANAGAFTLADLGLTGAAGEPSKADLIAWARGEDVQDEDGDPLTTQRKAMGDPLHARPAVVVYGETDASVQTVVFMATNEGYVHAIDAEDGSELWGFIPRQKLSDLAMLYDNPRSATKHYGIDGNMQTVVIDENNNRVIDPGIDKVLLVFGMRRGGGDYYAIDVSDPDRPSLAWRFSHPKIAQSWSTPIPVRVEVGGAGQADHKTVLIIGGGYDVAHDVDGAFAILTDAFGNAIFMLDADDGSLLWSAGNDASHDLELSNMTRAIPSDITVADLDGNGRADRMYVGDLGGQLWRFDIFDGETPDTLVTGGVIGTFGAESGAAGPENERRFFVAPDVALFRDPVQDRRFLSISIGSGWRAHPLDTLTDERFYSIRDPFIFERFNQGYYDGLTAGQIVTETTLVDVTDEPAGSVIGPTDDGWMLRLRAGEKVLSESRTFDNTVFAVSFEPRPADLADCNPGGGINRLYRVSVFNGDPPPPQDTTVTDPPPRSEVLLQEGIAPETVFLFPSPDDPESCVGEACSPDPVGCVGVECFDPGFKNVPVRTIWTQDGID